MNSTSSAFSLFAPAYALRTKIVEISKLVIRTGLCPTEMEIEKTAAMPEPVVGQIPTIASRFVAGMDRSNSGEDAFTHASVVGFDRASVPALYLMQLRFLPPRPAGEPVFGRRDGGPRFSDSSCGRRDIVFPVNRLGLLITR